MRAIAAFVAFALCACSPPSAPQDTVAALPACDTIDFTGALTPAQCQVQAGERVIAISYAEPPAGVTTGSVLAEVRGADGDVVQTMTEPDVTEYWAPRVQDINGDGVEDVIMMRTGGTANAEMALWVFNGERGEFQRIGAVTAVAVEREGNFIMASARSSAVEWEVTFYQIDEGGLHPYASFAVEALAGRSNEIGCRVITRPPRQAGDDISSMSDHRNRLCDVAKRVFE